MLLFHVYKAAFIPLSYFYKTSGTEDFQEKTICTSVPHNESPEQLSSRSGLLTETFITTGVREPNQGPPLSSSVSAHADICAYAFLSHFVFFLNRCHKLGQRWWRVGLVVVSRSLEVLRSGRKR